MTNQGGRREPAASAVGDDDPAVAALRSLVRAPTVSHRDPARTDGAAFDHLLDELARRFPLVHRDLAVTRPATHALLLHWRGRTGADPLVLMAHLDVVPVDGEAPWTHPPFDAVLADSPEGPAVWGRGTLDDKGCVVAICTAVERLLGAGFVPERDVWLSFGCDEEVGGASAVEAVEHLRSHGVRPWFVLDEGGAVAGQAFPGVAAAVGVIGVTEKGSSLFELRARGRGGHSSTPAAGGPTARIARAVWRLDRSAMPSSLPAPTVEMLRRMAPRAPFALSRLMGAADRLGPLVTRALRAAGPEAAAMTRTTLSVTTLTGSGASNVIATTATAGVNARILVGDSVAGVAEHLRRTIGDPGVEVSVVDAIEPSPVSPWAGEPAFSLIERTVAAVFPDAVATPYAAMAATDSRHFTRICNRVYRFAPFRMSRAQRQSIHSYDERLTVSALLEGVDWYAALIEGLPA
ncbi:M20/M25/M40 family metallo-hydrolase [Pseudonocardia sp. KRD291]|uniref:M20/M25/M40 family metallo-hydrolase n=1 Tax=Pseudonocardia sp. KRD291 TaxID=2792007 RepID=UPI001C4A4EE5|nr:M20/M25/M40 family metallo-hydrolase [Pseudonocardia sp. KRD291]MBW0102253.1 M20/M25/M40 family metallo-hydrolase [Pseudonocardia sp. KRD291]